MKVILEAQWACDRSISGIPMYTIELIRSLLSRGTYCYELTFFDKDRAKNNHEMIARHFGEYGVSVHECNTLSYRSLMDCEPICAEKLYNDYTGASGDVFHFMSVVGIPPKVIGKVVVTIHDLIPILFPEFTTAISTLAKWYAEGLIDPDYSTADVKKGDSLMLNNTSAFYFGETGGISGMYMSTWKDSQPQAKVVGIATPTAASDGKHYTNDNDLIFDGTATVISKNNKFPVESCRFMDFWYSPEGHMLQNFGFEGVTYTMVNGNPKLTEWVTNNPDGLSIDQAIARHTVGAMNSSYINDSRIREQRMLFFDWQRDSVTRWRTQEAIRMPRVQFTAEESRRLNQIMADINTLRNEMFDKFVMGKEPLSGISAFTARLKSMGIDEATAIQQAALDRLNNRK